MEFPTSSKEEMTPFSSAYPCVQTPPFHFHSSNVKPSHQQRKKNRKTMATILRVLSISSQRGLTLTSMPQFLAIQRLFCNNKLLNPISNTLVAKLLQVPNSRIKSALDSEDTSALKSFGDSWESLVISLRSSSPQKAHLVIFKFQSFFLSFYSPLCTVWSLRK